MLDNILRYIGHLDYINLGVRNKLIMFFSNPDKMNNRNFVSNFFGYKYSGNLNSYIDWCVYYLGCYSKYELVLIKDILSDTKEPICLDIGANIGHHSLFLSTISKTVHAFEPYEIALNKFDEHIKENNIDNIKIHRVALGLHEESRQYYQPTGSNNGTGSFIASHATDRNISHKELKILNGDNFIHSLNLEKIDFIKIDVEGFEGNVLNGLKETIQKYKPTILLEYSSSTRDSFINEFKSIFPTGYNLHYVSPYRSVAKLVNLGFYQLKSLTHAKPHSMILAKYTN